MDHFMPKKIFMLVTIFFLTLILINPSSAISVEKGCSASVLSDHILYVGGTGPNNYTRIQEAIDAAGAGDTVFVYDESSPYTEHLIITTSILLIGENKHTTVIQGPTSNDTIRILVDNVTIQDFTIRHHDSLGENLMTSLFIRSNNNVISDNIFLGKVFRRERSIILYNASENKLSYNMIQDNYDTGIELENAHSNLITENIVNGVIWRRGGGILLLDSSYNVIFRNEFRKNSCCVQINELANYSTYNQIIENNFLRYYYRMSGVYFYYEYHRRTGNRHNVFDQNYWNRPRLLPKYTLGWISLFHINTEDVGYLVRVILPSFDFHPASSPYQIGE